MEPSVRSETTGAQSSYRITGEWTVDYAESCLRESEKIQPQSNHSTIVQCGGMTRIDITGAWLLNRKIAALTKAGAEVSLQGFKAEHFNFIEQVGVFMQKNSQMIAAKPQPPVKFLERTDALLRQYTKRMYDALMFIGWCIAVTGNAIIHPSHFRFGAFIKQCEAAAVRAAPIVALISFLIAIVTSYQGAAQLKRFGAEIFSVNLVTISVLREMGVLLTAIMLAGRSGSAFAAEIGAMKLNEEIDALKTTGLEPMEVLVLPRILALLVMMPLLTFLADIMGFLGSGMLTVYTTNTSWLLYYSRLSEVIRMGDFWVGMSKAPVFGLLIGMVGCYHGMAVENSAESVGRETTNAVVASIFLVMMADAIFSIVFTIVGI
jgi:phospholipid/cholesterol/gamma-HCH transport system permease protein